LKKESVATQIEMLQKQIVEMRTEAFKPLGQVSVTRAS
jgi:hypothetical protein